MQGLDDGGPQSDGDENIWINLAQLQATGICMLFNVKISKQVCAFALY